MDQFDGVAALLPPEIVVSVPAEQITLPGTLLWLL